MLKKRSTAIVILVVVVVLGTLFGTNRTLASARKNAAEIFYQGSEGDGYGIENKLDQRQDKASNLMKLGKMYSLDAEVGAVQSACTALDDAEAVEDAASAYAANQSLTEACDALSAALQQESLTAEQEQSRSGLMADLSSYELQLERLAGDYNAAVREFNEKDLAAFPAGILARLTGVHKLEAFA